MRTAQRQSERTVTVADLMSPTIVAGDPRQSLPEAAARMRAERVSALALVVEDSIVGILTERDLMRAMAEGREPASIHVSEYMTQSPQTIESSEAATSAAALMIRHGIRHLPVTRDGRLAGFLSARDLLALAPGPNKLPVSEPW